MIKAKKSLGQNFLNDQNNLKKIIDSTTIKNKIIMEVGPGTGNLTSLILSKCPKKVIGIEKDDNLIEILSSKFKEKLVLINEDILKINEKKCLKKK